METIEQIEILLAEDNAFEAELAMAALRSAGLANNLFWVKDGQEALDYLFRNGSYAGRDDTVPGFVLLDIHMPNVTGIEVLRAIKANVRTQRIPVVMLTSSLEERNMAECYRLGVNSYMVKPIDFRAFTEIVRRAGYYWLAVNLHPGK